MSATFSLARYWLLHIIRSLDALDALDAVPGRPLPCSNIQFFCAAGVRIPWTLAIELLSRIECSCAYQLTWLFTDYTLLYIHDYTWLYDSDIIEYHNVIILLYLNDPESQCARRSNVKQHEATCDSEDSEKSWGAARGAKVLSTGTKGFGSPNPSWNPGDCDSKPHPPGMEG